nr:MAG TPA: hypothetical protein [Caudoviricetes sp.]
MIFRIKCDRIKLQVNDKIPAFLRFMCLCAY